MTIINKFRLALLASATPPVLAISLLFAACSPEDAVKIAETIDGGCQEDESCWDCNAHGNGLCGPNDTTPFVADHTADEAPETP